MQYKSNKLFNVEIQQELNIILFQRNHKIPLGQRLQTIIPKTHYLHGSIFAEIFYLYSGEIQNKKFIDTSY